MHDLECFINLCVCSAINPACVCRFSTLHPPLLQPRLQVRLRVRREPRLRPHREMDQKRSCGATSPPLQPQRVQCLLDFVFSRVPLSVLDEPRDPSVPPAAATGSQTLTTSVQRFIQSRRTYTHVAEACKSQQAKALRCRLSPQCIRADPATFKADAPPISRAWCRDQLACSSPPAAASRLFFTATKRTGWYVQCAMALGLEL